MRHNTTKTAERIIVALDLGSSQITAMAAKVLDSGQVQILGIEQKESVDVQYGVVKRISNIGLPIGTCIRLLQNRVKISPITEVFIAVGGHQLQLCEVSAKRKLGSNRLVSEKVLEDMINECKTKLERQDGIKVYTITPLYYTIDNKTDIQEAKGVTANEIEGFYQVTVGAKTIYDNTDRCLERTGLVLTHAPLKHDSISTALLNSEDQRAGTAIIDLGAETTTLAIYKEHQILCYYSIPLGSKHITRDIQAVGISLANAEKLKCLKGMALESMVTNPIYLQVPSANPSEPAIRITTTFLAHIIEARLTEIIQPILAKLQEYQEELQGAVLLTGGGSMLNGITEFVQQYTPLPVGIGSHIEWLSHDTSEEYYAPNFSQLVGTLILADEYLKTVAPTHTPKAPKVPKKILNGWGEMLFKFFDDENNK